MVKAADKPAPAQSIAEALNGGEAIAYAMRQIDPEVVAAYPITPQTVIIEKFSEYVAEGSVNTEFVAVESEHAALSACIGSSAAGARSVTATAGPGLALMFEVIGVTSGMRLPVVLHLCTRSLSAPLDILNDHSDAMAMREMSWIMLAGSSPQEAYDQSIFGHLIAEDPTVKLPLANMVDGFVVTHSVERVDVLPDDVVKKFVGEYEPEVYALQPGSDMTFGALDFRDFYFEHKRQQQDALEHSLEVTRDVLKDFAAISGREYNLIEPYMLDDAEIALIQIGSSEGLVHGAVNALREQGVKAGSLRIRLYRPFPTEEVQQALAHVKAIGVIDRAMAYGAPAHPLMLDINMVMSGVPGSRLMKGYVHGLGGRVTTRMQFQHVLEELAEASATGHIEPGTGYIGLREEEPAK